MNAGQIRQLLAALQTLPEVAIGRGTDRSVHYGFQGVAIHSNGTAVARFHCSSRRFESLEALADFWAAHVNLAQNLAAAS